MTYIMMMIAYWCRVPDYNNHQVRVCRYEMMKCLELDKGQPGDQKVLFCSKQVNSKGVK